MYFVTPSDPGITLIGIYETQIYGFGENDEKLCIYTKSIFDIGKWKEYYLTDIDVVRCDSCETGIHVVTGLVVSQETVTIWIAARENEFTCIFSINLGNKKFIRSKMLNEIYSELSFHDFNLCSKCLSPIIRYFKYNPANNVTTLVILPQKYHETVGIFSIFMFIEKSMDCLLWKKPDSFKLVLTPISSNILVKHFALEVLSVSQRSEEEDGRIQKLSIQFQGFETGINMSDDDGNEYIWHEAAFCDGLCLSRTRQKDGKSVLQLYEVLFDGDPINFTLLDYCTVDADFPSIDSAQFFVSWRNVDKQYISKTSKKAFNPQIQSHVVPSFIVAQTAAGIVVIPFRILSLSEAAYLSLARISRPPAILSPLPVEQPSYFYYCIQRIRKLCGKKKSKEDASWMSIEFIKQKIGWPNTLPLTNAPKLPVVNSK